MRHTTLQWMLCSQRKVMDLSFHPLIEAVLDRTFFWSLNKYKRKVVEDICEHKMNVNFRFSNKTYKKNNMESEKTKEGSCMEAFCVHVQMWSG